MGNAGRRSSLQPRAVALRAKGRSGAGKSKCRHNDYTGNLDWKKRISLVTETNDSTHRAIPQSYSARQGKIVEADQYCTCPMHFHSLQAEESSSYLSQSTARRYTPFKKRKRNTQWSPKRQHARHCPAFPSLAGWPSHSARPSKAVQASDTVRVRHYAHALGHIAVAERDPSHRRIESICTRSQKPSAGEPYALDVLPLSFASECSWVGKKGPPRRIINVINSVCVVRAKGCWCIFKTLSV